MDFQLPKIPLSSSSRLTLAKSPSKPLLMSSPPSLIATLKHPILTNKFYQQDIQPHYSPQPQTSSTLCTQRITILREQNFNLKRQNQLLIGTLRDYIARTDSLERQRLEQEAFEQQLNHDNQLVLRQVSEMRALLGIQTNLINEKLQSLVKEESTGIRRAGKVVELIIEQPQISDQCPSESSSIASGYPTPKTAASEQDSRMLFRCLSRNCLTRRKFKQ